MMAKESFVLVSLKEDKAKKLAQVITNQSCKKILEYLTEREATESEIAQKLNLPISTVHYNLSALVDAGLVITDEYHYSKKGKEVNHYKLANKYIIIAPRSTWGIKEKLKSILPVTLLALATSGLIHLFAGYFQKPAFLAAESAAREAPALKQKAVEEAAVAADMALEAAPNITQNIAPSVSQVQEPNVALWFLAGSLFIIAAYFIISLFRKK